MFYSVCSFWLSCGEWIEGARRDQEIRELAAAVVRAGADGDLDEGSDIADRERDGYI